MRSSCNLCWRPWGSRRRDAERLFLRALLLGTLLLGLAGCTTVPTPAQRLLFADQLAAAQSWRRLAIEAPPFVLTAYLPERDTDEAKTGQVLTIYLEGDGLAWSSGSRRSPDPSPINPLALRLAMKQPRGPVAYLARPCQLVTAGADACEAKYWTNHRFSPEVIESTNRAITKLMAITSSSAVQLVGYSGGGAVATLVAAQRNDVAGLRTVSGTLDHAAWTRFHLATPLKGSLNAADVAAKLRRLPQLHFVGDRDEIVPRQIAETFLARQGAGSCAMLVDVAGAGHSEGWLDLWPKLLLKTMPCADGSEAAIRPAASGY